MAYQQGLGTWGKSRLLSSFGRTPDKSSTAVDRAGICALDLADVRLDKRAKKWWNDLPPNRRQHCGSVLYVKRDLHCLSRSVQLGRCLGEHPGTTPGARVCGVVVALRRGRRQLAALGLVVRQRPRHSRVFIRHHARD